MGQCASNEMCSSSEHKKNLDTMFEDFANQMKLDDGEIASLFRQFDHDNDGADDHEDDDDDNDGILDEFEL